MAPTDSEDRQVAAQGLPGERELEIVPLPDDAAQLRVGALPEKGGIDVRSTGQDECCDPVEKGGGVLGPARRQDEGQPPSVFDGPDVLLSQNVNAGPPVIVARRDADGRPHHIRSGTGMPRTSRSVSISRTKALTRSVRNARRSSVSA